MLKILQQDVYLQPFKDYINQRHQNFLHALEYIQKDFGSLQNFANSYNYFGFTIEKNTQNIIFREWLPNAQQVHLIGEFNNWNFISHSLHKLEFGIWEIILPKDSIPNFSAIKLAIITQENKVITKIPAYIERVKQNQDFSFDGQFLLPSTFTWTDQNFTLSKNFQPIIYEAHIGMATEEHKVGTYLEFAENILPKIKDI